MSVLLIHARSFARQSFIRRWGSCWCTTTLQARRGHLMRILHCLSGSRPGRGFLKSTSSIMSSSARLSSAGSATSAFRKRDFYNARRKNENLVILSMAEAFTLSSELLKCQEHHLVLFRGQTVQDEQVGKGRDGEGGCPVVGVDAQSRHSENASF